MGNFPMESISSPCEASALLAADGRAAQVQDVLPAAVEGNPRTEIFGGLSDYLGLCGGGLVSEQGRVSPVARGALRSQPTDGLRKPLSSPVEPVSVVAGGVSQDGRSGGHSYTVEPVVERAVGIDHAESETTGEDISWEQPGSAGRGDEERWYRAQCRSTYE
ncbi:hypothetical protein Dimus_003434 [Dionaea muscipula]